MKASTIKKALLTGTAIVAVGFAVTAPAYAADTEMAGAAGTPTNMLSGFTSGDDLLNIVDDANDFGALDVDNGVTAASINSDFTGGLALYDGTNDTASGDTLTVGYMDVATSSTLTLLFGGTIADGAGTDGAEEVNLVITGTLGEAGASTLTRGGTLAILGTADEPDGPGFLSVNGKTLMTAITSSGGAGGAAAGGAVTSTFGNASTDTFNVTGLTSTGGAGSGSANGVAGGASTVTVNGAATIGATGLSVVGGNAAAGAATGAAGGASSVTFNHGVTLSGATAVTGGNDHNSAGGTGGNATLTFADDVTSNSTLALSTGAQAAGGGGLSGSAAVNFAGDATFSAITLNDNGDGSSTITFNGTTAQSVTGTINGVGGAEGDIVISNANGVTFNSAVGNSQGIASILLSTTGGSSAATFRNTVSATTITLGDGLGTGTNTLTLDATTNNFTVTGTVDGTAGDTDNIVIAGGASKTVTFAGDVGGTTAVESITINAGTTGVFQGAVVKTDATGTDIALGSSASTVVFGGDAGNSTVTVTGNITGAGTVTLSGDDTDAVGHTITGSVGTSSQSIGTLNVNLNNTDSASATDTHTITGDLYATNVVFGAASAAGGSTIGGTLALTAGTSNRNVNIGTVTTAVNGDGNLSFVPGGALNLTSIVTGNVGTSTAGLRNIVVGLEANSGDATVDFRGNVYATAITVDEDSGGVDSIIRFNGTSAQTVNATIDGQEAAEGGVVIGNGSTASNVTFTKAVGGSATVENLTVNALSTLNISKNVDVEADTNLALAFDMNGTLNIDSNSNTVRVDAVQGTADYDGTVVITGDENVILDANDNFTFDGLLITQLTSANDTLTINSDTGTVTFAATSDTTITAGNEIELSDELVIGANGRTLTLNLLKTSVFDPDATDVIDSSAGFDIATGAVFKVGIHADTFEFDNNATVTVFDGGANAQLNNVDKNISTMITDGNIVLVDTALVDIVNNTSTAQDLLVKMVHKDAAGVFEDGSTGANAANALMALASASTSGNLETARGNLLGAASAEGAQDIAESLAPDANRAGLEAGQAFSGEVGRITSTRLASIRDGGSSSGVAAGEMAGGTSWWVQGFGTKGNQDERDGVKGYDFTSFGGAVGADTQNLTDGATIGIAVGYAKTEVESDNSNATETDIDSYQIALYGDYSFDQTTYVSGQVGYTFGSNDTRRFNVGGISGLTADGDFDSNQFNARAELGRHYMMDQTKLTPKLMADYTYYNADDYTEGGAGTAGLNVDQESVNALNLGVGVDAAWEMQQGNGSVVVPALHAAVKYDVIGDEIQTTNTFVGGGNSFDADGSDPAELTLDLGADVIYKADANWDLKAGYYFQGKEDYTSHSGLVKAAYKF